jgi:uncharacterized protein (TIGR02271 family)
VAKKRPVHVEPREKGWAVMREGSERATSVQPTQAEAAREGREIARREKVEFFLHAQDGRVREHRNYGEETPPSDKGVVGQAADTVGAVTGGVSTALQALGPAGDATRGAEAAPSREAERSGDQTNSSSDAGTRPSDGESSDTEEVRGLTDAERDDRSRIPEEQFAGYEIYAQGDERIGTLEDLFVDEDDNPEYVGVRAGSSSTRSTLIPADVVTVDDGLRRMVVSRPKGVVEAGPSLGYDEEVTPELEERTRRHYGLTVPQGSEGRSGYGAYYRDDADLAERERTGSSEAISGVPAIPSEAGEIRRRQHDREGIAEPGSDLVGEEFRVRRTEEELRVGTREREVGAVRVRKRVRTDHETIVVPKKRVEVTVERVPVEGEAVSTEGEAAGTRIEEDEIVVPVVEEEVVVEKRPVVKEEIRIRKEVVEEIEEVEEDVRREEVEVDEQTERREQ